MPVAPVMLSARGLTGQLEPSRLVTGDLHQAVNLEFHVPGLVQKDPGSLKINSVALSGAPRIVAGREYFPTDALQRRVVATSDGKLYKDNMSGAFATTLKSGLTTGRPVQIVDGGAESVGRARKMFFLNGADPVQVLSADGVTTSNIAAPPADWTGGHQPTFMTAFRGFKVAGGVDNNIHFLYGSKSTDDEDWTGTSVLGLPVYPGEGRRMVAALAGLGRLWVFKWPRGVYWIDDSDTSVAGWFAKPLSREMGGAPTPNCATQIEDATIAFLTDSGHIILIEETAGTISGAVPIDLTKELNLLDTIRTEFNLALLDRAWIAYYKEHKELHVGLASFGSTVVDRRLVFDFASDRPRAYIVKKDVNESLWFEFDATNVPRPRCGDATGFVHDLNRNERTVDGLAYPFIAQTAPTDFSDLNPNWAAKKLFYRLHLEFVPSGNFNVSCDVVVDGRTLATVPFNMGSGGSQLSFVLPAVLGGTELRRRSIDIGGEGYYLSLLFSETGPNNPQLARAFVEFETIGMAP